MVRFFHTRFLARSRKGVATILALVMCMGYGLGSSLAILSGSNVSSLMRTAVLSRVSIVCLLPVILLPFLFSALAVFIRRHWLLIPIAFFRSVSFNYLGSSVLCAYGRSGWLVLILFLFSDWISLPVLCWLWMRLFRERNNTFLPVYSFVFLLLVGIISFDCYYISPFLVSLLS